MQRALYSGGTFLYCKNEWYTYSIHTDKHKTKQNKTDKQQYKGRNIFVKYSKRNIRMLYRNGWINTETISRNIITGLFTMDRFSISLTMASLPMLLKD